jgi:hypothetical protein
MDVQSDCALNTRYCFNGSTCLSYLHFSTFARNTVDS